MKNTFRKYSSLFVVLLFISCVSHGQNSRIYTSHVIDSALVSSNDFETPLIYNPQRDAKRLLINTGVNCGMSLVKFGILWVSPESFSNWNKDAIRDNGWCQSWKDNVKAGPVEDHDSFFMNKVMHPWGGAVYYMSARGSGFRWWESFVYSGLLSTFMWEYGIEAFAEVPSWPDLIITPIAGSAVGECFYLFKGKIIRNNKRVLNSRFLGITSLVLMDPVNEITDAFGYKTKHKVDVTSSLIPLNSYTYSTAPSVGFQVSIVF